MHRRIASIALGIVLVVFALSTSSGCAPWTYTARYDVIDAPVYTSGDVPRPYQIIGQVTSGTAYTDFLDQRVIEELWKEAKKMGGHALLDVERSIVPTMYGNLLWFGTSFTHVYTAYVIIWTDGEPRP